MSTALTMPTLDDEALAVIADDPMLQQWLSLEDSAGLWTFKPRADRPDQFDEQHSFVYNRDPVSFLIGGNAAGTTTAAAFKLAKFVLEWQPPPRRNTPFWIISNTYEQACNVVWGEKLLGMGLIPDSEIDWGNVHWLSEKDQWPLSVPLLPWPEERMRPWQKPGANWRLEFKSYEQGRRALQARSIGGFMFSEQFPWELFVETLRGCREYMYPGGQFAEFTPIEPELCLWIEKVMDDPKLAKAGWRFYRCNTELNKVNLADGWFEQFFSTVPDEMLATRLTGALATFEGVIYQTYNEAIHTYADDSLTAPPGMHHHGGIDWGASEEHPFAFVWGCYDGSGNWYTYDEYWNNSQGMITQDHALEVLARSIYWGWPMPDYFRKPNSLKAGFVQAVKERVCELKGCTMDDLPGLRRLDQRHGESYADPSRPGEINYFNTMGITTHPASNDVHEGINHIRSKLKVNIATGMPRWRIHKRCQHLREEMRKYRWLKSRKVTAATLLNPKVARPEPLKRDDDTCDAARYKIFSVERQKGMEPASADYREYSRRQNGVNLERPGNGHVMRLPEAMQGGWFKR